MEDYKQSLCVQCHFLYQCLKYFLLLLLLGYAAGQIGLLVLTQRENVYIFLGSSTGKSKFESKFETKPS